ncbi:KHG/KDPG aldolase [Salmonella enterica subsp. enterica]|uniref:KHG/KDPG aldolase n=1 Tax=Salmonella enterica I TaxID=59201 RepID=A0A3S5DMT3_SALET|nr:KHG/KDPG aldolase [Salmonella enterica subsp. enterica]
MKNWKTSAEAILTTGPVVPVIVVNKLEHAVPMAKALVAGGVRVSGSDFTYGLRDGCYSRYR